jgi:organic hydroperoxide reductase OsmC/OhrA
MLTQLARVSEAHHIELDQVAMTVSPRFSQEGSILADTIQSRLLDIETSLEITTSAPSEAVAQLIATAERMCFMMNAIRAPHEVRTRVTVNGTAMA